MLNPRTYENTRPDGIGVLEVTPGPREAREKPRQFVPLKRTELRGEIVGPLAQLAVTQTFAYSRSECPLTLEAVYRFPLPGDAAVTGVRVRFGEVEIEATLKEREQAEKEYAEAKRQSRQAALVTRESPDVFSLAVAGIQPDQEVTVVTEYVQLARAEGPGWSLRLPLTTSPRYVRGDEAGSRQARGQPLALLRDPGHRFALDLSLRGVEAATSPTHVLATTAEAAGLRLRLEGGEVLPDRDFVLAWRPRQIETRPGLQLFSQTLDGRDYFLALVAPPAVAPVTRVPREVILLVDHSGSMEGPKWEAADWAVQRFLAALGEVDAFNLGLFHDTTRWFARRPARAEAAALEKAVDFLKQHTDSGGTELGVALEQTLTMGRTSGDYTRHVLIITDAEVSDAGRILRLAEAERKRQDRRRISVLCIDSAPNAALATQLAETGGGVARFLTSSAEEGDITTALDEVLADWAQPALAGLSLALNRPRALGVGRTASPGRHGAGSEIDLGDLPQGRALWLAGFAEGGDGPLAARLLAADGREVAAVGEAQPVAGRALAALVGAWRVRGLENLANAGYAAEELAPELRRLGYDPAALNQAAGGALYAENRRADTLAALRQLLLDEALTYGIACAETAFVATRKERGQPVAGTVAVANALPQGWSEQFLTGAMPPMMMAANAPRMAAFRLAAPEAGIDFECDDSCDPPVADAVTPASLLKRLSRRSAKMRASAPQLRQPSPPPALFGGSPAFANGEAVLFDSDRDGGRLAGLARFARLLVRFPGGVPDAAQVDGGLVLLLFVGDLAAPRAVVRLADLIRLGGVQPLNVARAAGERVVLTLRDPNGVWAKGAPLLAVALL